MHINRKQRLTSTRMIVGKQNWTTYAPVATDGEWAVLTWIPSGTRSWQLRNGNIKRRGVSERVGEKLIRNFFGWKQDEPILTWQLFCVLVYVAAQRVYLCFVHRIFVLYISIYPSLGNLFMFGLPGVHQTFKWASMFCESYSRELEIQFSKMSKPGWMHFFLFLWKEK